MVVGRGVCVKMDAGVVVRLMKLIELKKLNLCELGHTFLIRSASASHLSPSLIVLRRR